MAYLVGQKVNIRNIKDTHAELIAQFEENDAVDIDVSQVVECDLSLVQLFESARNHAHATGKKITLVNPANEAIAATLERAGFLESFSAEDASFWLHKEMI
jgi:anti-anti-sigma regulatory factor